MEISGCLGLMVSTPDVLFSNSLEVIFPKYYLHLKLNYTYHREHTILLNRERVNKGTKRMNSLPLSPLVISFILRDIYWKNCCLQNTEALNSYQGLSALGKIFFVCIKFDKGGNSLPKHFERTANIHSNLLISLLS